MPPLALAEAGLALLLEDIGDIDARSAFSISASLSTKRHAQQPGQVLAHGGLAGAHRADQVEVGFAEHGPQSIRPPEGGRSFIKAADVPVSSGCCRRLATPNGLIGPGGAT